MKIMKNTNVWIGIVLAVLVSAIVVWGMRDENESDTTALPDTMTLYWGDGCSHCEKVKKFLEEKHVADRVTFEQKEVWKDGTNAKEMNRRAKGCGLSIKDIGVPFLFSDGRCFIGEPDVEKEFLGKAGMTEDTVSQPSTESK